jgi:hypothetical protein
MPAPRSDQVIRIGFAISHCLVLIHLFDVERSMFSWAAAKGRAK